MAVPWRSGRSLRRGLAFTTVLCDSVDDASKQSNIDRKKDALTNSAHDPRRLEPLESLLFGDILVTVRACRLRATTNDNGIGSDQKLGEIQPFVPERKLREGICDLPNA